MHRMTVGPQTDETEHPQVRSTWNIGGLLTHGERARQSWKSEWRERLAKPAKLSGYHPGSPKCIYKCCVLYSLSGLVGLAGSPSSKKLAPSNSGGLSGGRPRDFKLFGSLLGALTRILGSEVRPWWFNSGERLQPQ